MVKLRIDKKGPIYHISDDEGNFGCGLNEKGAMFDYELGKLLALLKENGVEPEHYYDYAKVLREDYYEKR